MSEGLNVLDHKYQQLRSWLDNIERTRGAESTVTISQIKKMLDFLDGLEGKLDDVIIQAFNVAKEIEKECVSGTEPEHALGTLKKESDGSVYKYGQIDFGVVGTDDITEYKHIIYQWFPWNNVAKLKEMRLKEIEKA